MASGSDSDDGLPPADERRTASAVALPDCRQAPRLGVLLPRLSPSHYEGQFWRSDTFRRWCLEVDALNIALRLLEVLLSYRLWQEVPNMGTAASRMLQMCWNVTLLAALHLGVRVVANDLYQRFRLLLVLHMRLYILLVAILISRELRRLPVRHPQLISSILSIPDHDPLHHSYYSFRTLLVATMAFRGCLHALPPTLPFALALPIQLVYLVSIFRLGAAPVTDLLTNPILLPHFQRACRTVSGSLLHPLLLPPPDPATPTICNTRQAVWALVLFTQLFFGCVLPLYLTFVTERRIKLRFLCQTFQQHNTAPASYDPTGVTAATTSTATTTRTTATNGHPGHGPTSATTPSQPTGQPASPIAAPAPHPYTPAHPPTSSPPQSAACTSAQPAHAADTPLLSTAANPPTTTSHVLTKRAVTHGRARDGLSTGTLITTRQTARAGMVRPVWGRLVTVWEWLVKGPKPQLTCRRSWVGTCLGFLRNRLLDALALWVLAAASWRLVLAVHVLVLQYARPLDFPAADKRWYWELLCGSDQPCCPPA